MTTVATPFPSRPETPYSAGMAGRRIITFGTFDVLHRGHLRILERAAGLGDHLTVGISADALNIAKKGKRPFFSQADRMELVAALRWVDDVFLEESLELKGEYIRRYRADMLVMGDDWEGQFDMYRDVCEVRYLPRTEGISTSDLVDWVRDAWPATEHQS